jgi:hypothetical protein
MVDVKNDSLLSSPNAPTFALRNSWGTQWGDRGYIKISMAQRGGVDFGPCCMYTVGAHTVGGISLHSLTRSLSRSLILSLLRVRLHRIRGKSTRARSASSTPAMQRGPPPAPPPSHHLLSPPLRCRPSPLHPPRPPSTAPASRALSTWASPTRNAPMWTLIIPGEHAGPGCGQGRITGYRAAFPSAFASPLPSLFVHLLVQVRGGSFLPKPQRPGPQHQPPEPAMALLH